MSTLFWFNFQKGSNLINTKYIYIASMDIDSEKEELFNEVYETEHIPALLSVPGVNSIFRTVSEPFSMIMGGVENKINLEEEPKYSAYYEIDSPEVLVTKEWAEAVEVGRWPAEIRPFTSNRRQVLRKILI